MFNKTCLVIYIGNGYSENVTDYSGSYTYSVDMRENRPNHQKMIYKPLRALGYKIDTALVTNKHKYYQEFKEEYYAIDWDYDEISNQDLKFLSKLYQLKIPMLWGPGNFRSGGRFLKMHQEVPEYDLYVFVRADAHFKIPISKLNIDENKMNFLWAETDFRFYNDQRESMEKELGSEFWFWNTYNRVTGNVFNVVPKKYIKTFLAYYWMEHVALHGMLKELHPIITLENDVNIVLGLDRCYVTDQRFCQNPVFTFNKKVQN